MDIKQIEEKLKDASPEDIGLLKELIEKVSPGEKINFASSEDVITLQGEVETIKGLLKKIVGEKGGDKKPGFLDDIDW